MAKKTSAKPPAEAGDGKTRKERRDGPGMGHNIASIREKAEPAFEALFELQDKMDSDMGGYKAEFKASYEKFANEIGCTKSTLIKEYKRALRKRREIEAEQQMDKVERAETEMLRNAMADTPFGDFLSGKLAKPAAGGGD